MAPVGPQQFKKGTHGIAGSISTDPKNTAGMGLGDDRGVSVAALNGKLIHHQKFDILEIHRIKAAGQSRLIQGFNGVPAQAEEGRDLFDWKHCAEPDNAFAKATCHPSMAVQPGKALQTRAAVTTGHAAARNGQPSLGIKNRQVTYQADFHVVNTVREHAAPIADHRSLGA
jgi:hypothetical protein